MFITLEDQKFVFVKLKWHEVQKNLLQKYCF